MTTTTTNGGNGSGREYKELGVLWERTKKNSTETYLTGVINLKEIGLPDQDVSVVIFTNKNKQKDTHPDLRIYLSEKKPQQTQRAAAPTRQPQRRTAPVKQAAPAEDSQLI